MIEYPYNCPYCNASVTALLDPSVLSQEYIEDCEVCCQPIQIKYTLEAGEISFFTATGIEQ